MLSISEPGKFYYLRKFHDMRCKYGRILSVIHLQMDREPQAGEMYIMMSKDMQTVRLYSYDRHSCSLYEKRFDKGYKFMKVSHDGDKAVFSINWGDVVVLLGSPVIKILKIKQLYYVFVWLCQIFPVLLQGKKNFNAKINVVHIYHFISFFLLFTSLSLAGTYILMKIPFMKKSLPGLQAKKAKTDRRQFLCCMILVTFAAVTN